MHVCNLPFRMSKQIGMKLRKFVDTVFDIARIVQWKSDFKYYVFLSTNIALKFSIAFLLHQPQRMFQVKMCYTWTKHIGFLGTEGYNIYKKKLKNTFWV